MAKEIRIKLTDPTKCCGTVECDGKSEAFESMDEMQRCVNTAAERCGCNVSMRG